MRIATRASEKREQLTEIDYQLADPGYFDPDFLQPPYPRWEDAHPLRDAWRWYLTDPHANRQLVAAIIAHRDASPDCDCHFWVPSLTERAPWIRSQTCVNCKLGMFDYAGLRLDELEDPVMVAMWRAFAIERDWIAEDLETMRVFLCSCCQTQLSAQF